MDLVIQSIDRIILHQVFKRDESGNIPDPIVSNEFASLDQSGMNILEKRITDVIGRDSHSIEMIIRGIDQGSAYDCCKKIIQISNQSDLVELSKKLALKMSHAQSSTNAPGGILVVLKGTIGSKKHPFIGIIKAELHDGFNVIQSQAGLLLEVLQKLMLTPQQKLYKIALFIYLPEEMKGDAITPEDFKVIIYDHLMSRSENNKAARYFFDNFLECDYSPTDKKLTGDFYYYATNFISQLDLDDSTKIEYKTSLNSYIKNPVSSVVSISDYADTYLPVNIRDDFSTFLESKEIPRRDITKDIAYIRDILKTRHLVFSSKVKIVAPDDNFDELVRIVKSENEKTLVMIKGTLSKDE